MTHERSLETNKWNGRTDRSHQKSLKGKKRTCSCQKIRKKAENTRWTYADSSWARIAALVPEAVSCAEAGDQILVNAVQELALCVKAVVCVVKVKGGNHTPFYLHHEIRDMGFTYQWCSDPRPTIFVDYKILYKTSTQRFEEFKNEVILTAKLQHVNLVKVLGDVLKANAKHIVGTYFGLVEHAYKLWKDGKGMAEFMDSSLDDTYSSCKQMRCLQVALLCVQEVPND
ncbi:hypothetical protein JRO89_XS06G0001300 [Xanthoceras sorbifolium]|uniref:Serine-threonine/tyrosine-protein kinase catalytic domain-containing protein n=1 Tax=Xanthoceras sorbifolium TaxID=99658 RepID=A0ABQ8HVS5_9ROSI|nr:hypothetical protein JRO89_XS06G0001300 [Xanthoceras sorbifolium]